MIRLATPVSHLFNDSACATAIVAESDALECRDRTHDYSEFSEMQQVFHCELQPIHVLSNQDWSYLEYIKSTKPHLELITFHIASCCDQPKYDNGMFELGGRQYSRPEMIANAKSNFSRIKGIFGANVRIAIENNNFYPTAAYTDVTEPSFIREIVAENDIFMLFDIAHARVTCFNTNQSFEQYKSSLPLDKIVQIHLCSYAINSDWSLAYDAHNRPNMEDLHQLKKIIKEAPNISYVTIEYYRDLPGLLGSITEAREVLYAEI